MNTEFSQLPDDPVWLQVLKLIVMFITAIVFCILIGSCSTTKVVEVETVRDVYHNSVDTIRDSIFHDVFRNIYIKGDTVYNDRVEYIYKYRYINRTDTVIERDTIPTIVEVQKVVEVKKPLAWWQVSLMSVGAVCIVLAIIWCFLFRFNNLV